MLALSAWRNSDTTAARKWLDAIAEDGETPPGLRSRAEALQASMSYYPNDLVVVGWNTAFVYDSEAGAESTIRLLEYANSQLLQFRHYDDLLTRELTDA